MMYLCAGQDNSNFGDKQQSYVACVAVSQRPCVPRWKRQRTSWHPRDYCVLYRFNDQNLVRTHQIRRTSKRTQMAALKTFRRMGMGCRNILCKRLHSECFFTVNCYVAAIFSGWGCYITALSSGSVCYVTAKFSMWSGYVHVVFSGWGICVAEKF